MHDWVSELSRGQWVLDLGAGAGSLKSYEYACSVVSVDCDPHAFTYGYRPESILFHVIASGDSLPFAGATFDLILCHHVLEHVANLEAVLKELSRVLKPDGRLYVSVPNGYGLCDGIYRYVFEGGDHVNRFTRQALIDTVQTRVGVELTAWQKLYSSFAYLARTKNLDVDHLPDLPARLRRIARLPSKLIAAVQSGLYLGTRLADRIAGVDWALYGWAFYFERKPQSGVKENPAYVNVCLYCGSGHPAESLVRSYGMFYRCSICNSRGIYFPPFRNAL